MESEQKRTLILLISSLPFFVSGLFVPEEPGFLKPLFFCLAYLICGATVLWEALYSLFRGKIFSETMLMALATLGAIAIGEYAEAAMVMILYTLGEFLEDLAVDKSRDSISKLLDLRPDKARVLRGEQEELVLPESVLAGETILILPGERVPLDGKLLSESATLDTSALTGESMPRTLNYSDTVLSGTVNLERAIKLSVTAPYSQSTVKRILDLTENASEKKSRREALIDRFARVYTPCVALAALFVALIPIFVFHLDALTWIRRALNFLVISCPCALVISIPLSFFAGLGAESRLGVLVKGAVHLEDLSRISTLVFDKTGTLTRGVFEVVAIHPQTLRPEELIDLAALAESHSTHPIALSILRSHDGHIDKTRVSSLEEHTGLGITAVIDRKRVCVGNARLMEQEGVNIPDCPHEDASVVHVSVDREYCGHLVISDTLRPDAKDAIADLKALGVQKTVLLTGDSENIGKSVGETLGIDEIHCELLPDGKLQKLESLLAEKSMNSVLAFLGDGINDAPALTRADLGVALAALGSDAAVEASDALLMEDKLSVLAPAIKTARKTLKIARENLGFALIVKFAFLALSLLGVLPMALAVFADVGVTLLCIANALRAYRPAK